jgi:hypothetical protein
MSRCKRLLALLSGVLALGAVIALPARPASADPQCPQFTMEPTIDCPGDEPPPPAPDGMWTPPPPVDMPMQMQPVANTPTEECFDGLEPFEDIYATDTNDIAYTFILNLSFCLDKRTGLITKFEHFARDVWPEDRRVVVLNGPVLLQNESTPIARGAQAPAGRFRYTLTVQFRPTPDSPVQTYVHRLGVLLQTNPRRGRLLSEFYRDFP